MGLLDETLDAFRSAHPNGRRNLRVAGLGLLAAALAWIAHRVTLGDVRTQAWQAVDSPDWAGGSALLFLLAHLAVLVAVRKRESPIRYAVGTLVIPAASLGVGVFYADERRWQLEARDVFAAYTHRFPEDRLTRVYVTNQTERYMTVCANDGPDDPSSAPDDLRFCVEIVVGDRRRQKVQGGYRFYADEYSEYEPRRFSCFGDPIARCEE